MKWCLQQYREFQEYKKNIEIETAVNETAIIDKTKLWIFCQRLFQKYKFYIEEKGGWKDFWVEISTYWKRKHKTSSGVMQMRFLTDMRLSQTGKSIPDAEWLILNSAMDTKKAYW